jgi:hypothetical protein
MSKWVLVANPRNVHHYVNRFNGASTGDIKNVFEHKVMTELKGLVEDNWLDKLKSYCEGKKVIYNIISRELDDKDEVGIYILVLDGAQSDGGDTFVLATTVKANKGKTLLVLTSNFDCPEFTKTYLRT